MSRGFPLQDTGPGMNELFHDLQVEQEREKCLCPSPSFCEEYGKCWEKWAKNRHFEHTDIGEYIDSNTDD